MRGSISLLQSPILVYLKIYQHNIIICVAALHVQAILHVATCTSNTTVPWYEALLMNTVVVCCISSISVDDGMAYSTLHEYTP
jgi:hypothetical protein